jgi:formate hydrogenlyase subunit 3/multisubunit Na+/H+ antiporter MnhD subunit
VIPALILLPLVAGLVVLLLPRRGKLIEAVTVLATAATFLLAVLAQGRDLAFEPGPPFVRFAADTLSSLVVLFASLFAFLVALHSVRGMEGHEARREYHAYLLWTVAAAVGALLSDGFVAFVFFWGVLAVLLYLLVGIDGLRAQPAAIKSFVIVGGADLLTLLGIVLLWDLAGKGTFSGVAADPLPATGRAAVAFLLVLAGAVAKAGAMPLHTWIPSAAKVTPAGVMALLPASLDKLLGIYLLARLAVFLVETTTALNVLLMALGAVTIVAAATMAIVQQELKRLLAWCAIAQVGYILLGLGTATAIGIAGALFHMVNHAVYKSCLFLCAGNVEHRAGTTRLDRLGGLARAMPATFGACLVAALAVSGIPPLNGFVSKWMVYQATIGVPLWPVFLLAAMFGSALTLAALIKVLYAVFLGPKPEALAEPARAPATMAAPVALLAALCVLFGVFAALPLDPIYAALPGRPETLGLWSPGLATWLLLLSLAVGAAIYWLSNRKWVEEADVFVGGEDVDAEDVRVPGTHFYSDFKGLEPVKAMCDRADRGAFDVYELTKQAGTAFVQEFRRTHTGILGTYLLWIALGLAVLLLALVAS